MAGGVEVGKTACQGPCTRGHQRRCGSQNRRLSVSGAAESGVLERPGGISSAALVRFGELAQSGFHSFRSRPTPVCRGGLVDPTHQQDARSHYAGKRALGDLARPAADAGGGDRPACLFPYAQTPILRPPSTHGWNRPGLGDIRTLRLSYSIPNHYKLGVYMKNLLIAIGAALGVRAAAGLDYRVYSRI